jgi:5-methyltetrahydropteroyltriglutamate--homocysteine methyltransferase
MPVRPVRLLPTVEGNALTHDEQIAKLRLIVETARDIWGD